MSNPLINCFLIRKLNLYTLYFTHLILFLLDHFNLIFFFLDHLNYEDDDNWEEQMRRKKLQLEMEQLELINYKIKLELYEMEQKLNLGPSKYTANLNKTT